LKESIDVYNPTLSTAEAKARGPWSQAVLPTGFVSIALFTAVIITSLPSLRRKSYNTFYYTHIFCNIGILICACIHASSNFYCILPGLILWIADLVWRQIGGYSGQSKTVMAKLEIAEEGWYRISLPESAKVLPVSDSEKGITVATHPIQSYYFIFPSISKIQNHAFTAANVGSTSTGPVFLFQRVAGKKQHKLDKEWTWKLGALTEAAKNSAIDLKVRVEGPYIPSVPELWTADHVLCIVGGTGLTGAYSLALWWAENRSKQLSSSFSLIWSVRHAETARLREWIGLEKMVSEIPNMSLNLQVTSEQGRLKAGNVLRSCLGREKDEAPATETRRRAWVYISGPEGLLSAVESACIDIQLEIRRARNGTADLPIVEQFDYYSAKWEV
jgi:ferric-chelate reductase